MSKKTIRALLIFSCDRNYHLLRTVLENGFIVSAFNLYLSNESTQEYIIGRISTITLNCLKVCPETSVNYINYLINLLKFIDNLSVSSLFETILDNNFPFFGIIQWIAKINLPREIVDEYMRLDFSHKAKGSAIYSDKVYQKAKSLLKLITLGTKNDLIGSRFVDLKVLNALSYTFQEAPAFIEGERWLAINALTVKRLASHMQQFFSDAINRLYKAIDISQCEVACIMFLTSLIDCYHKSVHWIYETQIYPVLLRIMIQFNENSILHQEFRKFIIHSLHQEELCKVLIPAYVPFMVSEVQKRENGLLAATFWFLLNVINEERKTFYYIRKILQKAPEFENFAKGSLSEHQKILNDSYGGDIIYL